MHIDQGKMWGPWPLDSRVQQGACAPQELWAVLVDRHLCFDTSELSFLLYRASSVQQLSWRCRQTVAPSAPTSFLDLMCKDPREV